MARLEKMLTVNEILFYTMLFYTIVTEAAIIKAF